MQYTKFLNEYNNAWMFNHGLINPVHEWYLWMV